VNLKKDKIKVIHCIETWLPITCIWLYNQINFLPDNVENYIVCQSTQNLDSFKLPNIFAFEKSPFWTKYLKKFQCKVGLTNSLQNHLSVLDDVIRTVRPDILHSHFGNLGWINSKLARKRGLKHIINFYGADVNYLPRQDNRWFDRYREMATTADKVLCEGPHMAKDIERLGIPADLIDIYRLGIDLDRIKFVPRQYNKGEKLRFLIVGTFREKKGIPYALKALGLFNKISDNFDITLIGDAHSERELKEKDQILRQIRDCNLHSKVHLRGAVPYGILLDEAYQHHIFISPSVTAADGDTEGGAPVSIIEMAASGMPVISTTHCDIPYVLSQRNGDFLVSERDSIALCNAIQKLLDSDWRDIAISNRQFIEKELDVKNQGKRLYDIYKSVLTF
jgi:colanic acid/amylovoran biosynthesis glycosyltransferase